MYSTSIPLIIYIMDNIVMPCRTIFYSKKLKCRYILKGKKTLNPYLFGLYAWRETTTLQVRIEKVSENHSMNDVSILEGELSI